MNPKTSKKSKNNPKIGGPKRGQKSAFFAFFNKIWQLKRPQTKNFIKKVIKIYEKNQKNVKKYEKHPKSKMQTVPYS